MKVSIDTTTNEVILTDQPTRDVIVTQNAIPQIQIQTCAQGPVGPRGEQGLPGASGSQQLVAAMDLGGHRVIAIDSSGQAIYADNRDTTAYRVQGISSTAAVTGDMITVLSRGTLNYPANNLIPDEPIFLGQDGFLTQIPPSTGYLKQLGFAIAPDTINIELSIVFNLP